MDRHVNSPIRYEGVEAGGDAGHAGATRSEARAAIVATAVFALVTIAVILIA